MTTTTHTFKVVDIAEVPSSRRPGRSRSPLRVAADSLQEGKALFVPMYYFGDAQKTLAKVRGIAQTRTDFRMRSCDEGFYVFRS